MESGLNHTDRLALERTKLANERTFLAYFRTFVVFASSGVAIVKLSALQEIMFVGEILLIISPILLLVGAFRFFYVRRKLRTFYYQKTFDN